MKTSDKIESITCTPDGVVCLFSCNEENGIMTEALSEVKALEQENKRLRAALQEIAVQAGVHFDKRYTMNGFLAKDEHGEMCYFNDILNHLEQYTKRALEGE
jgi:hypothetical protein